MPARRSSGKARQGADSFAIMVAKDGKKILDSKNSEH
jgi:hypothetical protein